MQHSGYTACEHFDDYGVSVQGHIVYGASNPNLISTRTDNGLQAGQYAERNCHTLTPLYEKISLDLIRQFPLGCMHLVCLGVMRWILYFFKGSYSHIYFKKIICCKLNIYF